MHSIKNEQHLWYQRTYVWVSKFFDTSQILIFGGYLKVRECLHISVIVWFKHHSKPSDSGANLPRHDFAWDKWYNLII